MKFYKLSPTQMVTGFCVLGAAVALVVFVSKSELGGPSNAVVASPVAQMPSIKSELPTTMAVAPLEAPVPLSEKALPPANVTVGEAPVAWQIGNSKAATPTIPLNEKIINYAIVEPQRPEQLPQAGQQVQLPMLQGETLVANVETITTSSNGDYTWSGHLQGFGTDYPIVMTYGEHAIFATITTPQGSYTMESTDGLGWLYKNPAEIELSAPGAKDYLEVDSQQYK